MTFYCIADPDTVRGFRLAGVPGCAVTSVAEAAAALEQAGSRADLGIVVLTEATAARIRPQVDAFRLGRERPLLVEIPGPEGFTAGHRSLGRLVHAAVGVRAGAGEGA